MNYIVLDLEWNMGTPREELKLMPFEIIEIGAVRLNGDREEEERFSRLIHPQVYRRMHWANKNVVHIENTDLRDAEAFEMVYSEFLAFCGDDPYIFCTWGDTDLTELQRNIYYFNCLPLTEGPLEFLDVQKLYGYNSGDPKHRVSLERAVEECGIPEDTGFHRAVNDAIYTSEVLKHIDRKYEAYTSFNTYHTPNNGTAEVSKDYGKYVKYISCCYKNKHELLYGKKIRSIYCPTCGTKLMKEIPPFSPNGKNYLMMGKCEEHGYVKSKIRVKKDELKDKPYAIKTTRLINEEERAALEKKYQKSTSSKSE